MTVAEPNIARRRLKAPREDGEVLLEPSGNELAALIDANIQIFQDVDYDVQGRPFTTLRQQARAEVVAAASEYSSSYLDPSRGTDYPRLLVAGHQPGLFHPGVWLKNAALDGLSRQHGAVGVNLQIDNDTLKSPSIRVPGGSIEAPTAHQVAFDGPLTEIPFEERQIVDRACFEQFDSEVATQIAPFGPGLSIVRATRICWEPAFRRHGTAWSRTGDYRTSNCRKVLFVDSNRSTGSWRICWLKCLDFMEYTTSHWRNTVGYIISAVPIIRCPS